MRTRWMTRLGSILLLMTTAAPALAAPDNVLTKVMIPFSGTVFDADTNENVDVTGQLLVKIVIYYKLTPTRVRAQYKLANGATAVGETSGAAYQTIGHDAVKFFWSAVVNGVLAPPLIVLVTLLTSDATVMGAWANPPLLRAVGWIAAAIMSAATIAMVATATL